MGLVEYLRIQNGWLANAYSGLYLSESVKNSPFVSIFRMMGNSGAYIAYLLRSMLTMTIISPKFC